jgi:hypothetical protein
MLGQGSDTHDNEHPVGPTAFAVFAVAGLAFAH